MFLDSFPPNLFWGLLGLITGSILTLFICMGASNRVVNEGLKAIEDERLRRSEELDKELKAIRSDRKR